MRQKYRTVLLIIALIALVLAAVFLLIDRTAPKAISELIPNADRFDACQIICVMTDREDTVTLTKDGLDRLFSQLEKQQYYKRGTYGNTMEGTVYHLYFFSQGSETFNIYITDLGKLYIRPHYYELGSEADPKMLSGYIETLLQ